MRAWITTLCVTIWAGGIPGALAQLNSDPPWNPAHIYGLPADVRIAVLAMCRQAPSAGHYFATYNHEQVNLHFELFHCDGKSFCASSKCLHQTYRLKTGHYRLAKSFYGPEDD